MNFSTITEKLKKLKSLWHKQGAQRISKYLYQRTVSRCTEKIYYQKWIAKNRLTKEDTANAHKQVEQ
jgi:O-antigen biosynthesis protein